MKKFVVCVTRDITEQCTVEVEAEDEHEARDLAFDKAEESEWSTTDWQGDTHYDVKEILK